jgi:hypothetical protein
LAIGANLAKRTINAKPGRRKKGTPNVLSGQAKENIAAVFDMKGGIQGMYDWACEHETEFYSRVYPRLIPLMVQGHIETVHKSELATSALERIITGIIEARKLAAPAERPVPQLIDVTPIVPNSAKPLVCHADEEAYQRSQRALQERGIYRQCGNDPCYGDGNGCDRCTVAPKPLKE